jgi:drug/metabolite transporter (DMT)-like permease
MKKFFSQQPLQAIAFMLGSMFSFASLTFFVQLLSKELPPPQIVFLRNAWSLLLILLWSLALHRKRPSYPTKRLKDHFLRAFVGFISMETWFYCLSIVPLALATGLSFTTPIFTTILAILFLGEKAGWRRWSAIIAGFVGVLVILHPDSSNIPAGALLVLFSSTLMACVGIQVKSLTRTDTPESIVFYATVFMLLFSVVPAIAVWQPVTAHQLWLAFWIAVASTAAHLLLTRAYQRADVVVLMPFDFTRLLFASIYAYLFFNETLDGYTLTGALIIVTSTVYIAWREKQLKKKLIAPVTPG